MTSFFSFKKTVLNILFLQNAAKCVDLYIALKNFGGDTLGPPFCWDLRLQTPVGGEYMLHEHTPQILCIPPNFKILEITLSIPRLKYKKKV
jgi:hypothetical protein